MAHGRPASRREAGQLPEAEAPPADLIELGVVRGPYGVKGWLRVAPHDADAAVLRAARKWWVRKGEAVHALEVTGVRRHGGGIVAKWAGCDEPQTAEAWKGAVVAVSRSNFPPPATGEFYWVDLVGARVVNRAGTELGKVSGLRNNGAQDLLEVKTADGAEILVPLVETYVDAIDARAGLIRVDWEQDW